MNNSVNQSQDKKIDISGRFKDSTTPHFSLINNDIGSIVSDSYAESLPNIKGFLSRNKTKPKFIDTIGRSRVLEIPGLASSDTSAFLEEIKGEKRNSPMGINSPLSGKSDGLRSLKHDIVTFNEVPSASRKNPSEFTNETREAIPLILRKGASGPESEILSPEESFEINVNMPEKSKTRILQEKSVPSLKMNFVRESTLGDKGQLERNDMPDRLERPGPRSSVLTKSFSHKGPKSSSFKMTRAVILALIRQAINKNKIFNPTPKELNVIQDKAYIVKMEDDPAFKAKRNRRRQIPSLKSILQKHGIVSKNLQKKDLDKILRDIRKERTIKEGIKRNYRIVVNYIKNKFRWLRYVQRAVNVKFHPVGTFRLTWDFISMALIFYDLVMIPFQMGFNITIEDFLLFFERMEDVFFFLDLVVNFRTGFFKNALLVISSKQIALHYLKSWFLIDFSSSMTSSLVLDNILPDELDDKGFRLLRFLRFLRFMRVLRALRLKRIFNRMEEVFYSNVYLSIKAIVLLLFYIVFLAHISACLWHFAGTNFYDDVDSTWVGQGKYDQLTLADQYVVSLYFAITTMMTVGYGDITPVNTLERVINIFVMLAGCGVFAYSMNKIGVIVQSFNQDSTNIRRIYHSLNKYMEKMDVSKDLRAKVVQYLEYMAETQKHGKLAEEEIFSVLSESLQEEVRKDINGKVLRENKMFLQNFDARFLSLLSYKLEEKTFSPYQTIFDEYDTSCTLYLISKGVIEIFVSGCGTVINRLERDDHFGELSFFTGNPRSAAARSITFSHVFSITKQDFLRLIEDHPRAKEAYHYIKDQMNLYNNFGILGAECTICGQSNHDIRGCNRIHFIPEKVQVITSYQKTYHDFCQKFRRKRRAKYSALGNQAEVNFQAQVFVNHHPNEIQKIIAEDSPRKALRRVAMKEEFDEFMKRKGRKLVKNGSSIPQVTFEGKLDQLNRGDSAPFFPAAIKKKATDSKNSFPTEEDIEEKDEVKLPQKSLFKQRPSIFNDSNEVLRDVYGPRVSLLKNALRLQAGYPIDSPTTRSLIDDQIARAMEGSFMVQGLQLMEQQQFENFDMVCNYTIYFPQNNIKTILETIKKEQRKSVKGSLIQGVNMVRNRSVGDKRGPKTMESTRFPRFANFMKKTKSEANLQRLRKKRPDVLDMSKDKIPNLKSNQSIKSFEA